MRRIDARELGRLLLAALAMSVLATLASTLWLSEVVVLAGSPSRTPTAFDAFLDADTFVVFVLPQLLVFATVSFVSMLVAAAIVRR